jgi:CheY-like chemotaxis protein
MEGYEVHIAANGQEGIDKLESDTYDLVIIDTRMPVMNGKQLYQHIKQHYPQTADKVLMTSGEVVGSDVQRFLDEAGLPFLPKPYTPGDLKSAVKKIIRSRTD